MISYDRVNVLMLLRKTDRKKLTVPSLEEATKLHLECGFADHQKMLLVFLFASDEEFRQLMMHPEILACDTIFGVEQSNKGLFTIAGLDGNNNAFNCGQAFISNERTWVFQLLFHRLLPKEFEILRPTAALKNTTVSSEHQIMEIRSQSFELFCIYYLPRGW
jgi:MULE transposase domain